MAQNENEYYDLGSYHRSIKTKSNEAQTWFNRGLIWSYGFNHEESARCFEKALSHDPNCIMAHWGLAYALGPNYNKPWSSFDSAELTRNLEKANRALLTAATRASAAPADDDDDDTDPSERSLVHALLLRYPHDPASASQPGVTSSRDSVYAKAMSAVHERFPEDLDLAALHADALMNLTPWSLWDLRTGEPAEGSHALEIARILERAIDEVEGGDSHPGLLHLYVHLMEMSPFPERALGVADKLRGLVPDAGHLRHMPSHLDILCGDYRRAIEGNSEAILADEKFLERAGALNFYSLYRCHDYHFRVYAAMFAGQYKVALETARRMEEVGGLTDELLRDHEEPPMADWLEGFLSVKLHVLVRFGRWGEILKLEVPEDGELYCVTVAMTLYAKGVALSVLGRTEEAKVMRDNFRSSLGKVAKSRTLFNNTCTDILAVASAMLDGELEYRLGEYETAFESLRKAITLSDDLPYDEPWGWMQPPRHAYGALLLEQGRAEEAVAVYSADLGLDDTLPRAHQHPNNIWALQGYLECLTKLGRDAEVPFVRKQLSLLAATADISVTSSCFCSTKGG